MIIADMTSADTGGQSYKLSKAITKYTDNTSRSFVTTLDYINFPYDILKGKHDVEFVKDYFSRVDVIHVHNKYRNANEWAVINPKSKWLIHQHGRFGDHQNMNEKFETDKQRRALRCVSTLNLLNYVNNDINRWIPAPFDLEYMTEIKNKYFKPINSRHPRKIRIAHSPTNRVYENTDLLIQVCSEVPQVELVLIEKQTNENSLKIRATCDITFDQMHLCYGNSGLEGMCFGQPVIAGMDNRVRDLINKHIGYEPFVFASPETLKEVITILANNPDIRKIASEVSLNYIKEWHCDKFVSKRVLNLYNEI